MFTDPSDHDDHLQEQFGKIVSAVLLRREEGDEEAQASVMKLNLSDDELQVEVE